MRFNHGLEKSGKVFRRSRSQAAVRPHMVSTRRLREGRRGRYGADWLSVDGHRPARQWCVDSYSASKYTANFPITKTNFKNRKICTYFGTYRHILALRTYRTKGPAATRQCRYRDALRAELRSNRPQVKYPKNLFKIIFKIFSSHFSRGARPLEATLPADNAATMMRLAPQKYPKNIFKIIFKSFLRNFSRGARPLEATLPPDNAATIARFAWKLFKILFKLTHSFVAFM